MFTVNEWLIAIMALPVLRSAAKGPRQIVATAGSLALTLPLAEAVRAEFAEFVEHGGDETDHSGLLLQLEERNGRSSKG
jgi:2-hydroxy-3-oxopropionate reductase